MATKHQYRKKFFRKWRKKGRTNPSKIGKPSRGLTQSRYFFKRKLTNLVTLSAVTGDQPGANYQQVPADLGSPGCVVRWQIKLRDLPDNNEFTGGLFAYYRINAMKVKMIPQFTTTQYSATTTTPCQTIVYTMPYNYNLDLPTPSVNPLTEGICLQTQACRTTTLINDGTGQSYYSKCRILNTIDSGLLGSDTFAFSKPKWLPTDSAEVEHYGLCQRFQPNFTSWPANMMIKLIITAYLEFKGVV